MIFSVQTRNTLACSLISAILCGFVSNQALPWFHDTTFGALITWAPGTIFGALFAINNIHGTLRIVFYTVLSTAIYYGAVLIVFSMAGLTAGGVDIGWGAFFAGLFGAFLLSIITSLFGSAPVEFWEGGITALVGGILGVFFVQIGLNDIDTNKYWILAFIIWQVPISWLLTYHLQKLSSTQVMPPAEV